MKFVRLLLFAISGVLIACHSPDNEEAIESHSHQPAQAVTSCCEVPGYCETIGKMDTISPLNACARVGRSNFKAEQVSTSGHQSMSWEIIRVNTCDSTQMGYAIGNWKITVRMDGHDTTLIGRSLTVWKRQRNGTWKNIQEMNAMFPV